MPEEYQPRPTQVAGYRALSDKEIDVVNFTKSMEEQLAGWWLKVPDLVPDLDRQWMKVARTHFQEGFSAVVRAVARPRDPFDKQP